MNLKHPAKAIVALAMAGVFGVSAIGVNHAVFPLQQAEAAQAANSGDYAAKQALKTLNSFYKPALKGQFPGAVSGLTIGKSTKQDVYKAIGEPSVPGKHADAF